MARAHDLGGRPGFGPVPTDRDELFSAEWERRAFGVTQYAQVVSGFNTDAFRHGIEREDPEVYATASYFEKWIRNGERMLVEGGVLAADDMAAHLQQGVPSAPPTRTTRSQRSSEPGAARRIDDPPAFDVGDLVRARAIDPDSTGHTRLPGYVAGHVGTVILCNGTWVFPDTNAHGLGEHPCWVYAVRFDANALWPDDKVDHTVMVDLFEPYLEAA